MDAAGNERAGTLNIDLAGVEGDFTGRAVLYVDSSVDQFGFFVVKFHFDDTGRLDGISMKGYAVDGNAPAEVTADFYLDEPLALEEGAVAWCMPVGC